MKIFPLRTGAVLAAILACTVAAPSRAEVVGSAGWSSATAAGAKDAQGYLVLTNNGEEERKLLLITSPVSDEVRLRRHAVDSQGATREWTLAFLKLGPGETLQFQPNGIYVNFGAIKRGFKAGEKVPLTLQFDGFEEPFTILLDVRPPAPAVANRPQR